MNLNAYDSCSFHTDVINITVVTTRHSNYDEDESTM